MTEINYERGDMPVVGLMLFFVTFVVGIISFIFISNDFMTKYNTTTTGLMNNTSAAYNMSAGVSDTIFTISPWLIFFFGGIIIIMSLVYFSN